jgi:hypothetical protein
LAVRPEVPLLIGSEPVNPLRGPAGLEGPVELWEEGDRPSFSSKQAGDPARPPFSL